MQTTTGMTLVVTMVAGLLVGCATAPTSHADRDALLVAPTAVVLESGVATNATFVDGIAVVMRPIAGAMVEATLGGQKFSYQRL